MLTKDKVMQALQTLPTTFTEEELIEALSHLEGSIPTGIKTSQKVDTTELELEGPSEDFKEWASLA